MRGHFMVMGMLLLAACDAGTNKCKSGTLFVRFSVASGIDADMLGVSVTVGSGAAKQGTFALPSGGQGSIEVDFPNGYPKGQTVSVALSAEKNGVTLASASNSLTLTGACESLMLDLTAGGTGDMKTGDANANLDLSAPPDLRPAPIAMIQSTPDLVGFVTKLDGSGSTDPLNRTLTYSWKFLAVPAGSTLTAAAFTPSATAQKPTFDPDFGGTYKVELTVTAPDSTQGVTTADVVVPTVPIFYVEGKITGDMDQTVKTGVVRSDGTGAHGISCNVLPDGGFQGTNAVSFVSQIQQISMLRSFYPASGLPLVAYLEFSTNGTDTSARLMRADETSNCAGAPPVQIDSSGIAAANHIHAWPRFSPDGKRVVYLDESQDQGNASNPIRVITAGIDGSAVHVVASNANIQPVPAIFLDNTHVAWVETDGSSNKHIFKASDANFAGDSNTPPADRTVVISCDDANDGAQHLSDINEIAVGGGGFIVSAGFRDRKPGLGPNVYGSLNLYRMTTSCSFGMRTTLVEEPATGESWDFDVSPDGLTVVFSSTHGQMVLEDGGVTPQHDLFVLPSDGSGNPKKLAGHPLFEDEGPVFIAGGRQIMWTQLRGKAEDLGTSYGGLRIINADGTHERGLYNSFEDANNAAVVTGGGNNGFTCDWVAGAAPTGLGVSLAMALALLVLLRHRQRS